MAIFNSYVKLPEGTPGWLYLLLASCGGVHQNSIPTRPQPPNSRQVEERWAKARLFAATSRRVSKYCVILGVRLQQKKQWVLPGIPTICGCIPSSCLVRLHILCSYPNVWRLYTDLVERIPPKSNNFMYSPFSDQPQYQIVDCLISSYVYIYILLLHPQLVKSRPQCCAVWRQEQFRNLLRRKVLPGAVRDRIPGWGRRSTSWETKQISWGVDL